MKNTILFLFLLLWAATSQAQNNRDTIKLSVYNTGLVFNLNKADFGGSVTRNIVAEMVRSYDTTIVRKDVGRDSSNRQKIRYVVERNCNKMTANLRDKIAVMELNKDCDVTLTCLKVQRAGAKALVIIHNSNSNGTIKLPKQGAYKDSIRIPIFTVGKEKGANITALLPTYVGIRTPSVPTQNLSTPTDSTRNPIVAQLDKTKAEGTTTENSELDTELSSSQGRKGWFLSPNPTADFARLDYAFSQSADIKVSIFNENGQLMQTYNQKAAATGTFQIDVHDWANGIYTLRLQNGSSLEIKKLMVQH